MKKVFFFAVVVFTLLFSAALTSFYPVATVGFTPVFARTWQKSQTAAENFLNAQNQAEGGRNIINFSAPENRELRISVKKSALAFLIGDMILAKEGRKLTKDFAGLSEKKAATAFAGNVNIAQGAKLVYGLDEADFKKLILLPQARQDVARSFLETAGKDFNSWFAESKAKSKVKLWFVPFVWDGQAAR